MDKGERNYGVSDLEYDIITTLGNLLEGSDALSKYEKDAQQAGDDECARLFRQIRDQNRQSAVQLRQALVRVASSG